MEIKTQFNIKDEVRVPHLNISGIVTGIYYGIDKTIHIYVEWVTYDSRVEGKYFCESLVEPYKN